MGSEECRSDFGEGVGGVWIELVLDVGRWVGGFVGVFPGLCCGAEWHLVAVV